MSLTHPTFPSLPFLGGNHDEQFLGMFPELCLHSKQVYTARFIYLKLSWVALCSVPLILFNNIT